MAPPVARLQYITQETPALSHVAAAERACAAGVRWVQLRVKGRPAAEVAALAQRVRRVCDRYGARLIVNDFPDVARTTGADGVHLGQQDLPTAEARRLLGPDVLLGGTANTFEQIEVHAAAGVDYVGVGPYRFTKTKEKLSPTLGLPGYVALLERCRAAGLTVPVVAIGGVVVADVPGLLAAGVHGVAVSSLLTHAPDPAAVVAEIETYLNDYAPDCR